VGGAAWLDKPAIIRADGVWDWNRVHRAAMSLSAEIDPLETTFNLCDSRSGFLVTWLAALRSGSLQCLPPSSGRADLVTILNASARPCLVADDTSSLHSEWTARARILEWNLGWAGGKTDPRWSPARDIEVVRLHTSGSTGKPQAHAKSLRQLALGAEFLANRLEQELRKPLGDCSSIVCSVPPQHMFGLEASVMLSLISGIPVLDRRPLLPADVGAAFEASPQGCIWVTTPLHLRSLARSGERLPNCRAVVASTMPLAATLAHQIEALLDAPVYEIYGSTETGAIATRRTTESSVWRPLPGVKLESISSSTRAWGEHFASPQRLGDQVAIDDAGSFALLGREVDMIKIAGRRASLSGLNELLHELPGLGDGVFYLPSTDNPAERLVLIHSGQALDRAFIDAWLRERMDAAFLPRAIIRVDRLPRSGAGKLPRASLDEIYGAWARGRMSS
jgi:acyl-coenzyme A synthetase/AMP-(fatty) acid ligase